METTSLGIGTHGNMSAGGELINKSISASNLAYGRKNNAKIAKFYEAVVTMLHNMAADDKLNLLAEYGDTGKLNRTRSNLDDVLAETIIINLPASELETLVKDVRADEAALKKDITTIRKRQKKNRIRTNFNADSFEDVYGKLGQAKNARQYIKLRKKLVGGFKIPRYMKSAYANLGREIKDILTNFYDKIEVSALAAEMGIDIVPGMKDREVQHAIINKTLLYVDLLVGKSKNKTNYSGAIVDKAPYDRLLSLTSYSWVTGKPGMSKEEYFKARAEAMAAKKEMQMRLKLESKGRPLFNGRSLISLYSRHRAKSLKKNLNTPNNPLDNKDILLNVDASGKYSLKDINELYALCSKYHVPFKEKDSQELLTVRLDRAISKTKRSLLKAQRAITGNSNVTVGEKSNINKNIVSLGSLGWRSKRSLKKGLKKGTIALKDGVYYHRDPNTGEATKKLDIDLNDDKIIHDENSVLESITRFFKYGGKNSLKRKRWEKTISDTNKSLFGDNESEEVVKREKAISEMAKKQKKAIDKVKATGVIDSVYDGIPVIHTDTLKGKVLIAVPTMSVNDVKLNKNNSLDKYKNIERATPVIVVNKDFIGINNSESNSIDVPATNNFSAAVLNNTITRKDDGTLQLSDALKIKKLDVGPKSGADLSKEDRKALQEDSKKYGDHISPAYLRPEALALGFNKKNKKGSEPEKVTPVFVVNKEPEDLTYSWLSTEFPKYMMGFATDVVAAPMGTGTIARPTLAAAAGTSLGMSIANDALKLADAQIGSLLGLATGGSGKANSTVTSFISGDSPRGLGDKNSYPEQVDIDWKNKSFNVKPIPTYATVVRAEAGKDKVTRFSKKERNAPMAIGFSSHVVRFNRKLDGVSGETDIGEAIKVYNVNNTAGISDKVNIDGTNTSLIELVGNMCKQLAVISEQLKTNNTTIIPIEGQTPIIEAPNISFQYPAKQNLVSTSFPDSLDSILQGV